MAQLEQCRTIPDFNNYLAFIFASGEGLPVEVREGLGPPGGGAVVGRNAGARLSCRSARTCGACLWGSPTGHFARWRLRLRFRRLILFFFHCKEATGQRP